MFPDSPTVQTISGGAPAGLAQNLDGMGFWIIPAVIIAG